MDELKIPKNNIVLITINKKIADINSVLKARDVARLYLPIGRG